ncbi:hypothetical protein P879_04996 [Paragonimus westermani]|uniref:GA-binding protein transcription factor, beta n=1 Tax=Paragonimus westermani TaxID=34504 RepID=A0A8T0DMP6_9TREM|nr:hypothetical protein P879_04996 [Paragonimus westermani]
MNQYIIPLPHNDPRLFSHVSHAFSLVDLGKRLLDAAKNGDVEEVKSLMNSGAPFTTDWLGISPLHFAAMNGHLSSCEALLRAGISRDARTKVDRTPLHLAAQEGHADIVELLLRNGAEIEAKDMLRMTALHWAAERGHTPVVQMLMRFGADARLQNKFEMTPLDIAERKGYMDAREAMLTTQFDLVSSVGRMAAISGDLANANAYILTEEETLVPAAPPADEVVVTATTVDELDGDGNASSKSHSDPISSSYVASKQLWDHPDQSSVDCTVDMDLVVHGADLLVTDDDHGPVDSEASDDGLKGSANTADKRAITDDTCGRDVMLVETPDGDVLCVRQMGNTTGPEGLAIFTSTGERVHSPSLMAQVVEAMMDLPKNDDHMDRNDDEAASVTGGQCAKRTGTGRSDSSGGEKRGRLNSPGNSTSVDSVDDQSDEANALLAQLAAFVDTVQLENSSLCVGGKQMTH